jgi:hypothetical protein
MDYDDELDDMDTMERRGSKKIKKFKRGEADKTSDYIRREREWQRENKNQKRQLAD